MSAFVSIPYKRVTNIIKISGGEMMEVMFQSPISGSQTLLERFNETRKKYVSIPYKRVTNHSFFLIILILSKFQSPISGSQTF